METLIDTLKIFESNMGKTAHMQGLFDDVASHLFSQLRFPEHSISEVWIFMTSIFLSGQRVNDASENPKASFGGTLTKSGLYTARGIVNHPENSPVFLIRPELLQFLTLMISPMLSSLIIDNKANYSVFFLRTILQLKISGKKMNRSKTFGWAAKQTCQFIKSGF